MPHDHNHDDDHDCPVCSSPDREEAMEEFIEQLDEKVAAHGHAVLFIAGDSPSETFSYTVGLAELGWPELVLYSLGPDTARMMLNLVIDRIKTLDLQPEAGMTVEKALNVPVQLGLIAEDKLASHLVLATKRAQAKGHGDITNTSDGPSVTGLQLIWPDPAGRLPTDAEYDHQNFPQPLLSDKTKLH
ncbi:DUF4262 domain-containing protein [Erythrobacter aureus]|uniref:DUF4262 domain-containing protein n=1 Tax=Erythrobacter aureus TaxID=2182384 RepID=A0A345YJ04_9SPHN|nr:DUF4262 domain-containing protein [Erythrobacter aureus]AXK43906.1 DUF4262 domain-containing protein [Erythrobacter aureus]